MKRDTRTYKYSCRKCTIRQECIAEKSFSIDLKAAIARLFENQIDTFETWHVLQQDCLLIRREKRARTPGPQAESGLIRRLRQAKQSAPPHPPRTSRTLHTKPDPGPAPHVSQVPLQTQTSNQQAESDQVPPLTDTPCGFTVLATQRLVRLPDYGEVVVGRFEPGFSNPPDVDLAYEDGEIPSVSRRHALVTARQGLHWIEDMGSSNGTYVNGHPLPLGKSIQLGPGDRVLVGRCRLVHSPLPRWAQEPDPRMPHTTSLLITHTGQRIQLSYKTEIVLGRPDPNLGYVPDVDLKIAGDIATYVSRRHAKLVARSGWHFLEELGSAAGTRLNGRPIQVNDPPVMLSHGDQIWLGGCVIAYEWQLTR